MLSWKPPTIFFKKFGIFVINEEKNKCSHTSLTPTGQTLEGLIFINICFINYSNLEEKKKIY